MGHTHSLPFEMLSETPPEQPCEVLPLARTQTETQKGSVGANTGAVTKTREPEPIGCPVLNEIRRVTPKGAAKPWKTAENMALIQRVRAAGVSNSELIDYVRGCADLVSSGNERPIYWSVRQLFTPPTVDWWRNKVEEARAAKQSAADRRLELEAREAREQLEREQRRRESARAPADLDVRRAAAPLLTRIRTQELAASVLSRLGGGAGDAAACGSCKAQVGASETRCPACGATLIDANGQRRRGYSSAAG